MNIFGESTATLEEEIETRIIENLKFTDGKERTFFDITKGVSNTHNKLTHKVLSRLMREGVLIQRQHTVFRTGNRAPSTITMYQCRIPVLQDYVL